MDDSIFNTLNPNEISRQKKMSGKNFIQKRNALPISPLVSHTRARCSSKNQIYCSSLLSSLVIKIV